MRKRKKKKSRGRESRRERGERQTRVSLLWEWYKRAIGADPGEDIPDDSPSPFQGGDRLGDGLIDDPLFEGLDRHHGSIRAQSIQERFCRAFNLGAEATPLEEVDDAREGLLPPQAEGYRIRCAKRANREEGIE